MFEHCLDRIELQSGVDTCCACVCMQVSMHKMPRIWCQYLELLMGQQLVARTRRTFDRALQALPITQHDRVWQLYLVGSSVIP